MTPNVPLCEYTAVHKDAVADAEKHLPERDILNRVSSFFKTLGDPTRITILCALDERELCVCDIACVLDMTVSAVSHQLASLRDANLVKFRRDGKTVYYSVADDHVKILLSSGIEHVKE